MAHFLILALHVPPVLPVHPAEDLSVWMFKDFVFKYLLNVLSDW